MTVLQLFCHNKKPLESLSMEPTSTLSWNTWMSWLRGKNSWQELSCSTIMDSLLFKGQRVQLSFRKSLLMWISHKSLSCLTLNPNLKVTSTSSQDQDTPEKTGLKSPEILLKLSRSLRDFWRIQFCNGLALDREIHWDLRQVFAFMVMIWLLRLHHLRRLWCGRFSREKTTLREWNSLERMLWRSCKRRSKPSRHQSRREWALSLKSQVLSERTAR